VDQLYVSPSTQGQGLGTERLEVAKALSDGGLRLWAFQRKTTARSFSERRGFRALRFADGSGNDGRESDVL
jgi:GNAT superfamily N-acetyltransferase